MLLKPRTWNNVTSSWVLLIILALIWGSSFILIKKGLAAFSAMEVGSIRVISAALFMLPLVINKFRQTRRKELLHLFIVGFSGSFFPAILFAIAQTRISSSLSGVLNSMTPVFVLILGALFFGQRIRYFGIAGILLGFAGTIILITGFSFESFRSINYYAFFVILATLCYGINLNIIKFRLRDVKPVEITGISVALVLPLALVILFLFTGFSDRSIESLLTYEMLAVVVLGIMGTGIALLLFNKMVKMSSPLFASSVTYLIPTVAVMWGLLDGETLTFYHYAGLFLIIAGVIVINTKRSA